MEGAHGFRLLAEFFSCHCPTFTNPVSSIIFDCFSAVARPVFEWGCKNLANHLTAILQYDCFNLVVHTKHQAMGSWMSREMSVELRHWTRESENPSSWLRGTKYRFYLRAHRTINQWVTLKEVGSRPSIEVHQVTTGSCYLRRDIENLGAVASQRCGNACADSDTLFLELVIVLNEGQWDISKNEKLTSLPLWAIAVAGFVDRCTETFWEGFCDSGLSS